MSSLVEFDLSELNGINGFQINGIDGLRGAGRTVSANGDINNDGFADILIGAGSGGDDNGRAFVIYGKSDLFQPEIELASLNGTNGFSIEPVQVSADGDNLGRDVNILGSGPIKFA